MGPARKEPDQSTYAGRFAARLRTLREKAKLSTEQVADSLGVAQQTIYKWEAGLREPPLNAYPKLATLFGLKNPQKVLPEK